MCSRVMGWLRIIESGVEIDMLAILCFIPLEQRCGHRNFTYRMDQNTTYLVKFIIHITAQ